MEVLIGWLEFCAAKQVKDECVAGWFIGDETVESVGTFENRNDDGSLPTINVTTSPSSLPDESSRYTRPILSCAPKHRNAEILPLYHLNCHSFNIYCIGYKFCKICCWFLCSHRGIVIILQKRKSPRDACKYITGYNTIPDRITFVDLLFVYGNNITDWQFKYVSTSRIFNISNQSEVGIIKWNVNDCVWI